MRVWAARQSSFEAVARNQEGFLLRIDVSESSDRVHHLIRPGLIMLALTRVAHLPRVHYSHIPAQDPFHQPARLPSISQHDQGQDDCS